MVIRVLGSCVFEVPSVAEGDSKSEMKVLAEKDVDNQISGPGIKENGWKRGKTSKVVK